MNEWFEKLKKMPRWAWWAAGGTIGLVIIFALRARRADALPADVTETPAAPAVPAAPAASAAPSGGRDPERNGDTDSWLRSALGGLLQDSATLKSDVALLRMGLASQAGAGMGTAPNRGSIALPAVAAETETVTAIAAGVFTEPDLPVGPTAAERQIAEQQGAAFSDKFTGYSNISGPVAMPEDVYNPTLDTKRVYDPVIPERSLPAPAERVTQPGNPVFDPKIDYVREAFETGQIGREQLLANYYREGKEIPPWLAATEGVQ